MDGFTGRRPLENKFDKHTRIVPDKYLLAIISYTVTKAIHQTEMSLEESEMISPSPTLHAVDQFELTLTLSSNLLAPGS